MSKIPPHRHKASDVVETQDDYLLPYLRSLRDPSKIERAVIDGSEPLPEGTAFPIAPFDDQFFRLTTDITGYPAALYRYDGEADEWVRLQPVHFEDSSEPEGITFMGGDTFYNTSTQLFYVHNGTAWVRSTPTHLGSGTSNPSEGMILGDTFFRTDLKKLYTYNGSAWATPTTSSHDALSDVGASDHHSAFTSAQHASVEHLAGMLNQAIQPYNSNITFARKSGQEDDGITYTAGEIKFQDGTARTITPAGELLGMSIGDNYIYFKTDSTSLFQSTNHVDAISSGRGLLAIIIVVTNSDPDQPCAIQPFYAKGLNLTADTLAVTLLSAISAYLGNVEIAEGVILLGDSGIIVDEGTVILDDLGITIKGAALKLRSADASKLGVLVIGADGSLQLGGDPAADITKFADATIQFATAVTLRPLLGGALAKLGTPSYPFRYFVPTTTLANRPDPSSSVVGLLWHTREVGNNETKTWQCVQKSDATPAYGWIQTGIST